MDSAVDGNEAVLNFFPNKSEFNNYNVTTLSYNLNELVGSGTTQIVGLSTSIVNRSNPGIGTTALVHIGAATTLAGSSHAGDEVEVIIATV